MYKGRNILLEEIMGIEYIILMFLIGLVFIVKGGDIFVESSIWFSLKTGISYAVIGATIISIATTLPEFFVSTISSSEGLTDVSFGNAIGSFICNIGLIIGVTSLIKPIKIQDIFFKFKGIMLFFYLSVFYIFALDNMIGKFEGGILVFLLIPFIFFNIFENKSTNTIAPGKDILFRKKDFLIYSLKFFLGGFCIVYGAHILVTFGVEIANFFNISRKLVSLTLLAIGTSIPELVTSISAIMKDKHDLSIGNILGANILNISMVMGASALVSSSGLAISNDSLIIDIPFAFLFTFIFVFAGIFKEKISRTTGSFMVILYLVYIYIIF